MNFNNNNLQLFDVVNNLYGASLNGHMDFGTDGVSISCPIEALNQEVRDDIKKTQLLKDHTRLTISFFEDVELGDLHSLGILSGGEQDSTELFHVMEDCNNTSDDVKESFLAAVYHYLKN